MGLADLDQFTEFHEAIHAGHVGPTVSRNSSSRFLHPDGTSRFKQIVDLVAHLEKESLALVREQLRFEISVVVHGPYPPPAGAF